MCNCNIKRKLHGWQQLGLLTVAGLQYIIIIFRLNTEEWGWQKVPGADSVISRSQLSSEPARPGREDLCLSKLTQCKCLPLCDGPCHCQISAAEDEDRTPFTTQRLDLLHVVQHISWRAYYELLASFISLTGILHSLKVRILSGEKSRAFSLSSTFLSFFHRPVTAQ